MAALQFPCPIFKTQKWMDDYNASDMRCGDLSEAQLKTHYRLVNVSTKADPYKLTEIPQYIKPTFGIAGPRAQGEKITKQECATILFDEFRYASRKFSLYGPYNHLIEKMISHMQYSNGSPFRDISLDSALKEQILNDTTKNSTLLRIKNTLNGYIDWQNNTYPIERKDEFRKSISFGRLPKFNKFQDSFNGMGITVHDTWATHITLKSLQINNGRYRAVVHYKVQDHFGLDSDDISKFKFNQFHFFRIWFVLQRYNQFGFKPFMTNMETTVEITGRRNES